MPGHEIPAFHVMAKPTGARCNLRCDYCFFLEKEQLYPGSDFRMSDEVMEAFIAQTARRPAGPSGDARLAGRRADADGARLLPAGARGRSRARARRHGGRAHAPDQRRAPRRRVVRLPRRERLPRRAQHRRPARPARRLPARPGRAAGLRPRRRGRPPPAEARRGVQRALHGQRRQRRAPARGLPLLPRRARRPLHPADPDRRGRDAAQRTAVRARSPTAACSPRTTAAS